MRRLFFLIVIAILLAYSPLVHGDPAPGTQKLYTEQVNTKPAPSTGELVQTDNKDPVADPAQGSHTITPANADPQSNDNSHQKLNSAPTPSHGNTRNCGTSTSVQKPTHGSTRNHGTSRGARSRH